MNKPTTRDMFLGGNTSKGFFSYFNYLLSQEEATRIICLKGGPGTGKSSLMKKVSSHFLEKGYDIERFHCSSDDTSLDAILIKGLNLAMVDGTAPHSTDPKLPGVTDEIIDLASALNEKPLLKHKSKLLSLQKEVSLNFNRAYKFFSASKNVYEDWISLNNKTLSEDFISKLTESLKIELLPIAKISTLGKERHLFATAFTPNGIVSFTKELANLVETRYIISGEPGLYKNTILKGLGNLAKTYGYYVEYFHSPLIPSKVEHIIIPELNVGVFSNNEISKVHLDGVNINMEDFCDKSKLNKFKTEIEFNRNELHILLNKGLSLIKEAKLTHDELEKYYLENMNYDCVDKIYTDIINKFESYI